MNGRAHVYRERLLDKQGGMWIELTQDKWTVIDEEDWEFERHLPRFGRIVKVSEHRWHAHNDKVTREGKPHWTVKTNVTINSRSRSLFLHTLLTGYKLTDHIDRDGLNNRRSNLREATNQQNCVNRGPGGQRKFKGVYETRRTIKGKIYTYLQARIRIDGRIRYLGQCATEEEGARMYDKAAKEAWGEYAWLNFPDDRG